jgi:alkanesulfonate monooxygenase SsuD/methylene tetrahydromethanopterin reductase-like flavin-dependent oxidoreductase (luciferase family)
MRFGIKIGQSGYSYDQLSAIWKKSEQLGFESAWLHDHFLSMTGTPFDPCFESYTTLAALARDTHKIGLGVMVSCVGYRNPALLAKIGATIDSISKGRFLMGLGTGWYKEEYSSYGYSFLSARERLVQLRETLEIIKLMWRDKEPSFRGRFFSIESAPCEPKPVQKNVPVWVGVQKGVKILPRYSVLLADGLNTTAGPALCSQIIAQAEKSRQSLKRPKNGVTYSAQPSLLVAGETELERIIQYEAKRAGTSREEYLEKLLPLI